MTSILSIFLACCDSSFCFVTFTHSLKCCSLVPAADSSDNSDLEDDIILALNEWFCRKRQWTCSTRLEPQRRSDRKMSSGSQPLFSAGPMRLWCGWSVRTPPLRTARVKQTAFVRCLFPSLNVWSSLRELMSFQHFAHMCVCLMSIRLRVFWCVGWPQSSGVLGRSDPLDAQFACAVMYVHWPLTCPPLLRWSL